MPKPWEKYQEKAASGPWSKFQSADIQPPQESAWDRFAGLLTSEGRDKLRAEAEAQAGNTPDNSLAEPVRTGARSALETMTLGASEPVFGALHAVDRTFDEGAKALARKIRGEGGTDFDIVDALKRYYAEDVSQRRADKEAHGLASGVGGLGGAFMPGPAAALIGKATGLVGRGAQAAGAAIPAVAGTGVLSRAANYGLGAAGKVATGAAQGAAGGLAYELPRQVLEGSSGYIQKGDKDVPELSSVLKTGALVGGAIPAAGVGLDLAGKGVAKVGKKAMRTFLGPSEEHIQYYLDNPQAVNGAKNITELKDKVDDIVEALRADVDAGKLSVSEAKAQIKDVAQAAQAFRTSTNLEFRITSSEIKRTFKDATDNLEKAFKGKVQALKDVKAPYSLAKETASAAKDLKAKVVSGSQEATELIGPGNTIKIGGEGGVLSGLRSARKAMNVAGQEPVTNQGKAAAKELDSLIASFGNLPGEISGREAKELLKQIDKSERVIYASGQFTDDVSMALGQVRRAIDEQLKSQNPAYAQAMESVAKNRGLMDQAKRFSDEGSALSALGNVHTPQKATDRRALEELGRVTGRDFSTTVEEYARAQGILKDQKALDKLKKSLPQFGEMENAKAAARMIDTPEAHAEFMSKRLRGSGLLEDAQKAKNQLAQTQNSLEVASGKLEPFKNITPRSSQGLLERAMRGTDSPEKQIELKRQLERLSKLSDTNFEKALKDLRVKEAFNQQNTNGSRNVNLFGALGTATGYFVGGGYGAALGASSGAAIGGMVDKFGPKIAKRMLDGVLAMKASPTLQKIQALEIPPQAKAYLAAQLAEVNKP